MRDADKAQYKRKLTELASSQHNHADTADHSLCFRSARRVKSSLKLLGAACSNERHRALLCLRLPYHLVLQCRHQLQHSTIRLLRGIQCLLQTRAVLLKVSAHLLLRTPLGQQVRVLLLQVSIHLLQQKNERAQVRVVLLQFLVRCSSDRARARSCLASSTVIAGRQ